MKTYNLNIRLVSFLLLLLPILSFSQSKDSTIVYTGSGSYNKTLVDYSYRNLSNNITIYMDMQVLILDNNNITVLPDWFANLTQLRSLSIRNNNLKEVDILMYCEDLEELYLSGNPNLSELPDLSKCTKLKIIDVTNTKINELPINIREMENLAYFKYTCKKVQSNK